MNIETKTKLLKTAIYVAGIIAAIVFLAVRIRGAAEVFLDPHEYYTGRDLYKEHYISHFRESHPAFDSVSNNIIAYQLRPENPDINHADILAFGDSFFNFRYIPSFPEVLGEALNKKIYLRRYHNPFTILKEEGYLADRARLVIYEIGERGIYRKFTVNPFLDGGRRRHTEKEPLFKILGPGEAEQRYTALLQQSRLTHRLYQWNATFKFDAFGYMSPMTPVYSLDPPFLFSKLTVDESPYSFFYQHSDHEIDTICYNINLMRNRLKTDYDLNMLFIPVPNKISIYSEMVFGDEPYNMFLPRIYDGLKQRGVPFIDLYHPFNADTNILYFASDTHWNEKGIGLAAKITKEYLLEHGLLDAANP